MAAAARAELLKCPFLWVQVNQEQETEAPSKKERKRKNSTRKLFEQFNWSFSFSQKVFLKDWMIDGIFIAEPLFYDEQQLLLFLADIFVHWHRWQNVAVKSKTIRSITVTIFLDWSIKSLWILVKNCHFCGLSLLLCFLRHSILFTPFSLTACLKRNRNSCQNFLKWFP